MVIIEKPNDIKLTRPSVTVDIPLNPKTKAPLPACVSSVTEAHQRMMNCLQGLMIRANQTIIIPRAEHN